MLHVLTHSFPTRRSSDLAHAFHGATRQAGAGHSLARTDGGQCALSACGRQMGRCGHPHRGPAARHWGRAAFDDSKAQASGRDRKSVVKGKSVSVRVDLGGRRIIQKKTKKNKQRGRKNNNIVKQTETDTTYTRK